MKTFVKLIGFLVAFTISGCFDNRSEAELKVLNFRETTNSVNLALSDIIFDAHLIPLETNDQSLIGPWAKYHVGEKYIIAVTREKILQFSSNGKFIRCLSIAGRGPDEFGDIANWQVDKAEENLYFLQFPDNKIRKMRLEDGRFLNPVNLHNGLKAEMFSLIDQNRFAIFPFHREEAEYLVFYQDSVGKLIEGIVAPREALTPAMFSMIPPSRWDKKLYYYNTAIFGDTVFLLEGLKKSPFMVINAGEKVDPRASNSEGYSASPITFSPELSFFRSTKIKTSNDGAVNFDAQEFYMAKGPNLDLFEIESFLNDLTGKISTGSEMNNLASIMIDMEAGKAIFIIEAHELDKAKSSSIQGDILQDKEELRPILDKVTMDDNPIVLIGRLKTR
jgi:hypothetical protein